MGTAGAMQPYLTNALNAILHLLLFGLHIQRSSTYLQRGFWHHRRTSLLVGRALEEILSLVSQSMRSRKPAMRYKVVTWYLLLTGKTEALKLERKFGTHKIPKSYSSRICECFLDENTGGARSLLLQASELVQGRNG